MSAKVVQQKPFKQCISFHAWNADNSLVALSPNSAEVYIYKTNGSFETSKWDKEPAYTLNEHGGFISAIEWCHATDTLVTAGHDRNAYVWKYNKDEDAWKPTLVLLRVNRAAYGVKWSPKGDKFAVTSGAKCIPICQYEESNDWWISQMIKKHKSTVTTVDWCPNNKFIITGSTDFKARVCSAFIESLDSADDDDYTTMWGPKCHQFGEVLCELNLAKAWVNNVAWSPSGKGAVYVGQGSTIHFAAFINGEKKAKQQTVYIKELPMTHVEYLSNDTVLAIGYDKNPQLFVNKGSEEDPAFESVGKIDPEKDDGKAAAGAGKPKAFGSAFSKFQAADSKGGKFGAKAEDKTAKTFHKNTIYDVKLIGGLPCKQFTTSAMDGRVLSWDISGCSGFK